MAMTTAMPLASGSATLNSEIETPSLNFSPAGAEAAFL
jgi:hypothetical protein